MTIKIKTDGISEKEKATPKFRSFYQGILAQLNEPGFIDVLCAHEAAHLIFFTIAGTTDYDTHTTTIRYDPTIGDYTSDLAGIKLNDLPNWTPGNFDSWFHKVACGHAAGGVVARKLMPSSDGGDQDDRERFKQLCDAFNRDPNVKIDFDSWWKRAQDTVSAMIENPEFMAQIKSLALELRPKFGL